MELKDVEMGKQAYFADHWGSGWPALSWMKPYFDAGAAGKAFPEDGNDSASLVWEGAEGTGHLQDGGGRVDIQLGMWGRPGLGVLLIYSKLGGSYRDLFSSKGDHSRLREWVRSTHDTPLPVGLFISFERGWLAVKEFVETDGKLPTSVEWVANRDLPPGTFPDP